MGASANIKLEGLENNTELETYLNEKIIAQIEEAEELPSPMSIRAKLQKGLKAKGYYEAKIVVQESGEETTFDINAGQRYVIKTYHVTGYDKSPELSIKPSDPLLAQSVLEAQKDLLRHLLKNECFYNLGVSHKARLDNVDHSASIIFEIDGRNPATFGDTTFSGAPNIKDSFLQNFITYKENGCWKPDELEATKAALMKSGLISSLDVTLPDVLPDDRRVPIMFEIKERAPRSVKLGTSYNTSEGVGISAKWSHNNFFGAGEEVTVGADISILEQSLGLDFSKPYFLSDKQSLTFSSALSREDNDAFEEVSFETSVGVERELSRYWTGRLGVGVEMSQIKEDGGETENFGLVFIPGSVSYDSRDDVLNPRDGHTLSLAATPFLDAFGTASPFFKTRATGTTYFDFGEEFMHSVLALRTSLGSIWGAATDDIPASRRFYAGGGGSIRGFGYQEAGPIDSDNDPAGGRSLFETNIELRTKFTDTISGVVFVDGGGVYDSPVPDFKDGAYIGAGLGLRYYTDFGPIRFDVGVPLNKKENLDQNFQVYISIGQAF